MASTLGDKLRDNILIAHQRFRYFLLASAGAALAFTTSRVADDYVISLADLCWLFAVLAFGVSFALGLLGSEKAISMLLSNVKLYENNKARNSMQAPEGADDDHEYSKYRTLFDERSKVIQSQVERHGRQMFRNTSLQKWTLFIGAIFFGLMAAVVRFDFDVEIPYFN